MSAATLGAVRPRTFPARPINGGPLEWALPKPGQWCYEPKYNGWRALVHAPTGAMFSRHGQPLSIAGLFGAALEQLREVKVRSGAELVEWFDCEALGRRHPLGRGTLLVFDFIASEDGKAQSLARRKEALEQELLAHDHRQPPSPDTLYGVRSHDPVEMDPQALYRALKALNARWGCPFYEGLVAKRLTDGYPVQLRSPSQEFVGWVKHRWAF
jgi:ATP-dependent DNA ligase